MQRDKLSDKLPLLVTFFGLKLVQSFQGNNPFGINCYLWGVITKHRVQREQCVANEPKSHGGPPPDQPVMGVSQQQRMHGCQICFTRSRQQWAKSSPMLQPMFQSKLFNSSSNTVVSMTGPTAASRLTNSKYAVCVIYQINFCVSVFDILLKQAPFCTIMLYKNTNLSQTFMQYMK